MVYHYGRAHINVLPRISSLLVSFSLLTPRPPALVAMVSITHTYTRQGVSKVLATPDELAELVLVLVQVSQPSPTSEL